jgi:hypothetical protein
MAVIFEPGFEGSVNDRDETALPLLDPARLWTRQ